MRFSHWTPLKQNPECDTQYSNDQFSILAQAKSTFHLLVLEATYIKISLPILCRQKEFVYSLQIFYWQQCSLSVMQLCTVSWRTLNF